MDQPKLLLEGEDKRYYVAKKDLKSHRLVPTPKVVFAGEVVSYGFKRDFDDGRGWLFWSPERLSDDDVANRVLDIVVDKLLKGAGEKGADYVLTQMDSYNCRTGWNIRGQYQLLLKR